MNRFDQIANNWDAKPRRILLAKNICDSIRKEVKLTEDMSVLDIGTGTGLLPIHIFSEVKQITGIDNSQGMLDMLIEKAEKSGIENIDCLLFDADKDQLSDKRYELIISSMTFHHFTKPDQFLHQVYKSLKIGGKICIADLETEDGSFHGEKKHSDVKHFGFNKTIFNSWLQNAGFKNTKVKTVFKIDRNDKKYPVFLAYGEK